MSEENVEIVRRGIDAWNRRDLPTWLALFRADAEIDWTRSRGPLKGSYRGQVECESFWHEFFSTFEDVQLEVTDLTEAGSDVVVANTARARGREGIEVIATSAFVFTVEDAQITRVRMYQDRTEALEAAGPLVRPLPLHP
jgi:ketosteroid isomerase-like protein